MHVLPPGNNTSCWFGEKLYVICEIGLVNYSNLLFGALSLHPFFFFFFFFAFVHF